MKKIDLSIGERIILTGFLNQFKGNLDTLSVVLEDLKSVRLSEEEAEKIKLTTNKNEKGEPVAISWDAKIGTEIGQVKVELHGESIDYLLDTIEEKNKKKEFTLADLAIVELRDKLKKSK